MTICTTGNVVLGMGWFKMQMHHDNVGLSFSPKGK
jgi:hypothetical protein